MGSAPAGSLAIKMVELDGWRSPVKRAVIGSIIIL